MNRPGDNYSLDDRIDVAAGDTTNANVILVDLGASSTPTDAPSSIYAYPIPYRAPGVVMDTGFVAAKADVWALGCVIYRMIVGFSLFSPEGWVSKDDTNLEQIVCFVERLGPVHELLRNAWVYSDRHLTPDGHLQEPFPDERDPPLAETIRNTKPKGMGMMRSQPSLKF